ncbi:hypothetical protein CMV_023576 [Castanea mollissima]|uniref:Uncharacterized protein n=1 Tax=Castanea mollissima TaxID=60419 RepID=A0A8J4QPR3_9ROSI|nr:hypothetical protein CMV_023576 [Castanea mollissima]
MMGSLVKPSVVAKCTVFDGFSVEESSTILDKPDADLAHSMRTMLNPDGDDEKSTPQFEIVGCLVKSSMEKVGIGLGPKQSEVHCVYNLSPMTTSPSNSEVGECFNTYSGPFFSTSTPDGLGEKPTVFPNCLVMSVKMLRSDFERSFSVSQLQVALQVGALQTDADGGLVTHPWSASPVGVSGCIEYKASEIESDGDSYNHIIYWNWSIDGYSLLSLEKDLFN